MQICVGMEMMKQGGSELSSEKMIEQFEAITKDSEDVQREVLKKILDQNQEAEYLKKMGLNGKIDPETFKACVPLVTYSDLRPYFNRIVSGEVSGVLTGKPVTALSLSSGTSEGKPKICPFTEESMDAYVQSMLTSYAYRNREYPVDETKMSLQFLYISKKSKNKAGLITGLVSSHIISNPKFKFAFQPKRSNPDEVLSAQDPAQAIYCHLLLGLKHRHQIQYIFSVFAHNLVVACQTLDQLWQELCHDIHHGSPSCTRVTSESLRASVSACPTLMGMDYGATEGWVATIIHPRLPPERIMFTVMPNIAYFEFIPLDEVKAGKEGERIDLHPVGLTDVKVGQTYELVFTNFQGMYRYRLGDWVEVTGFYNSTPVIKFVCRGNVILSIHIDKATEKDLQVAIEEASEPLAKLKRKTELIDFTSRAEMSPGDEHYIVFWELSLEGGGGGVDTDTNTDQTLQECCNRLDTAFADLGYVTSRMSRTIGPLELRVVRSGTFKKVMDFFMTSLEASNVVQFKMPRFVKNQVMLNILEDNVVKSFFSTAYI